MQDRFKFRHWDKRINKMFYPERNDNFGYYVHNSDVIETMQYTGLKDKNGKLIYDGDILYNPYSNYKYVVNFGKFTLNYTKPFSVNITGFYITYKETIKNEIDSLQMLDLNNIEVIGNVYQNPELLED